MNVKYVSVVNSGSSANLLAFMALTSPLLGDRQIQRGDEVITVAAGFPTTVAPIVQYGAVPVFVDVTIPQYNIDVTLLEKALSKKTKAVMLAHTLGNPFDMLAGLQNVEDKLILPVPCENACPSWFGFLLTCREGVDREKVVRYLEAKGVQTRILFAGNLIKHPCFDQLRGSGTGYKVAGSLVNTDRIMKDTFWIGVYPGMTDEKIDYMIKVIKEVMK